MEVPFVSFGVEEKDTPETARLIISVSGVLVLCLAVPELVSEFLCEVLLEYPGEHIDSLSKLGVGAPGDKHLFICIWNRTK